ncbi:uncharacterized protein TNCV_2080061 [Trichonephila clavipes]|nr:uncharacterized protein TNCV_2080061 [Trichonephila clavipes]
MTATREGCGSFARPGSPMKERKFVLGTFCSERMRVLYRSRQNDRLCVMFVLVHIDITPPHNIIKQSINQIFEEVGSLPDNLQVYVHTFSGDVSDVLLREIELFRRNLDTLGFCYKKKKFYVAIYNIPHNPNDSRNELWFTKCTK